MLGFVDHSLFHRFDGYKQSKIYQILCQSIRIILFIKMFDLFFWTSEIWLIPIKIIFRAFKFIILLWEIKSWMISRNFIIGIEMLKYFCDQNVCVTEGRLRVMVCIMKGQMSGNNVGEDDLLRNYRVVLLSSACYKRIPELLTLACGIETSSGSK